MSWFHRPMRKHQVVPHEGFNPISDKCAGGGDKAIHEYRFPVCCRSEYDSCNTADFKTPDLGKDVDTVVFVDTVDRKGAFNYRDLMLELVVVKPCSPASQFRHTFAGYYGSNGC